ARPSPNADGLIYRSEDSGLNWAPAAAPSNHWSAVACSVDGVTIVAAAYCDASANCNPGLIYLSSDSGQTWTPSSAPSNNWWSVAISASGTKMIAASDDRVFISTNSGATWEDGGTVPEAGYLSVAMAADGNRVLVAAAKHHNPGFLVTWPYAGLWRMADAPP